MARIGALVASALLLAGSAAAVEFKGFKLAPLDGGKEIRLDRCPTKRCLTVYVAPWCGYCRSATPVILEARDRLKAKGITTRVIVGMAAVDDVRDYAMVFGDAALLDPKGTLGVAGVPQLFLSDAKGRILRRASGVPDDAGLVESFALDR